jgi:uncharacterized protein
MTFEEIIRSFATSDTVPVEAIQAALEEPTAFVDKAVPLLERIAATESSDEEDESLAVLVRVLGEIGDERAFPPLMRVLALPSDELEALLGDTITETLGNVVISLAGDGASVLEEALADIGIDDFVRSAIFEAWTRLALIGKVSKDRAKAFLLDYPVRVGLDSSDFGWSSWVDSVTALGLTETRDLAAKHLAREATLTSIMDTPSVTFEDYELQLSETLADPDHWKAEARYQPFTDTIGELSTWHGYSEAYRNERASMAASGYDASAFRDWQPPEWEAPSFNPGTVASNPYKHVGRNDPCPCGSGKKFKKCCLETLR